MTPDSNTREALERERTLLRAIHLAQSQYIIAENPLGVFGEFLDTAFPLNALP